MKDNFIKEVQKFLNTPFRHSDFLLFIDRQKKFLLKPDLIIESEQHEYNALWDLLEELERMFAYGKNPDLIIGAAVSAQSIFDFNFKLRESKTKTPQ